MVSVLGSRASSNHTLTISLTLAVPPDVSESCVSGDEVSDVSAADVSAASVSDAAADVVSSDVVSVLVSSADVVSSDDAAAAVVSAAVVSDAGALLSAPQAVRAAVNAISVMHEMIFFFIMILRNIFIFPYIIVNDIIICQLS